MKSRWTNGIALATSGLLLIGVNAFAGNRVVIDELRKLRASLPANDPSREELSLRLADRLADEVLVNPDQNKGAEMDRKEAITLYQEVLPNMNGGSKAKVEFQLARLYFEKTNDPSAQKSAKDLFTEVSHQSDIKELKRESTLRLAEIAESNPKTAKDAVPYYSQVLSMCEGTDSCSYAHYRLAWIHRNADRMDPAIDEMKKALYDSKGQIREEALRDLIGFMGLAAGATTNTPDANLAYIDQLSTKLSRPVLLGDLAGSYFSNGNKAAGVKVLALTHSRQPTLDSEIRLMEETYGIRNWEQFRVLLGQFENSVNTPNAKATLKDASEAEKICRRLATQLDGERTSDKSHFEDFKTFTLAYLNLFSESTERAKIMEGYIAAEPSADAKLAQLKTWINDPKFKLSADDTIHLRELRAAIAQKDAATNDKLNAVVVEEMTALLAMEPTNAKVKAKSREYHYARARANYAMKDFAASTPEFEMLATPTSATPDQFAVQSQHLLLDTYNQQKDLTKMVAQAKVWTENAAIKSNPKFAQDLKEMSNVSEESEFQQAASGGQTQAALDSFTAYCVAGKFLPKSCDNAKVLAVNLQNYPKLLTVMETQMKQEGATAGAASTTKRDELAAEYENGAFYAKSAALLQKMQGKTFSKETAFKDDLKIALMYELGRQTLERDEELKKLTSEIAAKKVILSEVEERAYFATMKDANLLDAKLMKVATTKTAKVSLAENLEEASHGTPETKTVLLNEPGYQGSAWSKIVLNKADGLAAEVGKIKFYGRNGQVAFQKRVNRLKDFNQFSEKYLSGGADLTTRVKLLQLLKSNYDQMNSEILASPMPAQLSEEQLAQVKTGLEQMAKPFADKATELQALLEKEKEKAVTLDEKRLFDPTLASAAPAASDMTVTTTQSSAEKGAGMKAAPVAMTPGIAAQAAAATTAAANVGKGFDATAYTAAVTALHQNPKDQVALAQLKQIYTNAGQPRLAAYFEGRIQAMAMVGGNQP